MPRQPKDLANKEARLLHWFTDAASKWSSWRDLAYRDRQYYEGQQWTDEEVSELKRLSQPVITVNHIWSKVNSLVGMMLQQQPTIKCLPRGSRDAVLASIATAVIRYIFDINQFNPALSDIMTDMLTTGVGWADVRINPFLSHDPILVEHVPFDEVIYDPLSRKTDFSDARFVFRGRWIERDLVERHYPQAKNHIRELLKTHGGEQSFPSVPLQTFQWIDTTRDMVFVLEAQYRDFSTEEVVWDGVQAERYVPDLHDDLIALGFLSRDVMTIPVVRRAVIIASKLILDEPLPYAFNSFTLVPFVAHRRLIDGSPLSLVSIVKDIQDEINKRRSKTLHYLQAKRVIASHGAIQNKDDFMEELRRPDAFLEVLNPDAVRIEDDLQLSAQHFTLMQEAVNELSLISGIYPDFLGQPTNARTGAALRVRILQSQNSVQRFFSALERGLKQVAERVLALAKQYYTSERVKQIVDISSDLFPSRIDWQTDVPQIRNTLSALRADIVVKVAQGGFTERQEQLVQLVELMKVLPPDLVAMSLDVIIDAFDLPQKEVIKARLVQLIQIRAQMAQQTLTGGNGNGRGSEEA